MKAIVNAPVCPLMSKPRWDCELADEALFGMVVEVLEQTNEDYWRVRTHYRYEGYAPAACLLTDPAAVEAWEKKEYKIVLHKNTCDVLSEAKVQGWCLVSIPRGGRVAPVGEPDSGWQKVGLPDGREGFMPASILDVCYEAPVNLPEDQLRQKLVETAVLYEGTHYRWGGKSPLGIDCSGLVSTAYLLNGIVIYRDASIRPDFPIREITREEMKPGDLLFFPGHVAMYMGEGKYIHSTGHNSANGVTYNSLNPDSPIYREDLAQKITEIGSYF